MVRPLGSKYVLEEVLGRGATGEVWRGRTHEGAVYAFKVLHDTLTRDPETKQRFLREGSILTGLSHPNLVRYHDLVVEGDTLAIVMDLVEGSDLRQPLREFGPMRPGDVCSLGAEVADALAAVHTAGVVHRDIKPENVLLDRSVTPPAVRLTDFGIARIADQTGSKTTFVAGTAPYIAPEVADGKPAKAATDLYALGIMLYEMCCGVTPFAAPSMMAMLKRHGLFAPGRPPGIPDALWELIERLLAKDPEARPGPAGHVAGLLRALAHDLHRLPVAPALTEPPEPIPLANSGLTEIAASPGVQPPAVAQKGRPAKKRRLSRVLGVSVVAVILVGIVVIAGYATVSSDFGKTETPMDELTSGNSDKKSLSVEEPIQTPSTSPRATYAPGRLPDLIGLSLDQATAQIPDSVSVQIVREQTTGDEPDGLVIKQNPAPGSDMPASLQVTVSSRQVTQYLAELRPTTNDGELNTGTDAANFRLSGRSQLHAIGIAGTPCGNETGSAEYDLGQNFKSLTGLIGIDDRAAAAKTQATFEIYGDDRKLGSVTVALGKFKPIDINVTGVLRMTLRWTFSGMNASRCEGGTLVFGDAQLVAANGFIPPTPTPSP